MPDEVVLSSDIHQSVLSGDGAFAGFVSTDSFGGNLETGELSAVFMAPTRTNRPLVGESIDNPGIASLTLADAVDTGSEDIDALLEPASHDVAPILESGPAEALPTVDGGSSLSLDQVLVGAPDDVT